MKKFYWYKGGYLDKIISLKTLKYMRNTLVLILITFFQVYAEDSYSQNTRLDLELSDVSILDVLEEIENRSEYYFLFNARLVDIEKKVSVTGKNQTISDVLNSMFAGTNIKYLVIDRQIILSPEKMLGKKVIVQQNYITGKVTDPDGNPLVGVTAIIKETNKGTLTDAEGKFALELSPGDRTIVFSFIGMKTQEVDISGRTYIETVMEVEIQQIDEVVAIGYMTQKKADVTGSVAIISNDDIKRSKSANVFKLLQGKVPGVVIQTDGNPVESVDIQIRGITSINASPPLLVIDGLPTTLNMRNINPNDIESIQILKDAASASIYGSRAASGVILITTKQGSKGATQISYDATVGAAAFLNPPEMLNTQQYGRVLWQAAINDGLDPNETFQIYDYEWHTNENNIPVLDRVIPVEWLNSEQTQRSADTDWFKETTRLGLQQNHNLTFQSGTENAKHLFSINYYDNNGTQITTFFKRGSARMNSSYDFFNGRLKVGENISVAYSNYRNDNQMYRMLTLPPIVPVYDIYGGWGGAAVNMGMDTEFNNPVRALELNKGNVRNQILGIGNIFAELEPLPNLHFKTQFGLEHSSYYYRDITFTFYEAGGKAFTENGVTNHQDNTTSWTFTNTLLYNLLRENYTMDLLGGVEAYRYSNEYTKVFRDNILLETYDYAYLDAATGGRMTMAGVGNKNTLLSYFAKGNFTLMNKYLLSGTIRYDGSSKFPQKNKFGFFPAVSVGWRLSEESFLDNLPFISHLQVRASWGMNGNQNIPSNAINTSYSADYVATSYDIRGQGGGALPSGYRMVWQGNPDLRWEATEQTNLGLDFRMFNNRLNGSFDYFHKVTDGMLFTQTYMGAVGEGANMWINAANMTNNGIEAVVSYSSNPTNEFTYTVTGNISSYKNRIDDLPESVKYQYGGNGLDDNILGRPLNSLYGFIVEGIFQNQDEVDEAPDQPGKGVGRLKYKDLDHDGSITYEHDQTWIGVSDPDFSFGLNFSAQYRNFDFNMFWHGLAGMDIRAANKEFSDFFVIGIIPGQNKRTRILDSWTQTNTNTDIPALSMTNSNAEDRMSTYWIESGDYMKLRNIELGYTLPDDILRRLNARKLRVFVSAQNVITIAKRWGDKAFSGEDPELPGNQYQLPTTFLFGINSTF